MSVAEAKQKGYTHHARLYGFAIYFRDTDSDVYPKSFIGELMINWMSGIESAFGVNGGFYIQIISEL